MVNREIDEIKREVEKIKNQLIEDEENEIFRRVKPLLMNIGKSLRFTEDFKEENKEMFEHVLSVELDIRIEEIDRLIERDNRCRQRLSGLREKLVELRNKSRANQ